MFQEDPGCGSYTAVASLTSLPARDGRVGRGQETVTALEKARSAGQLTRGHGTKYCAHFEFSQMLLLIFIIYVSNYSLFIQTPSQDLFICMFEFDQMES